MARPTPRLFVPKNPRKYAGDVTRIVCRSSWERGLCWFLDNSPAVSKWASEEVIVPYVSPLDGRQHRYFVDMAVEFTDGRRALIEVKPFSETQPPTLPAKAGAKATAAYAERARTFAVNVAKWQAAHQYAVERGMTFEVFTENELRKLKIPV